MVFVDTVPALVMAPYADDGNMQLRLFHSFNGIVIRFPVAALHVTNSDSEYRRKSLCAFVFKFQLPWADKPSMY